MKLLVAAAATLFLTSCSDAGPVPTKTDASNKTAVNKPALDQLILSDANIPDILQPEELPPITEAQKNMSFGCITRDPDAQEPLEREAKAWTAGPQANLLIEIHRYESEEQARKILEDYTAMATQCKQITENLENGLTLSLQVTSAQEGNRNVTDMVGEIAGGGAAIPTATTTVTVQKEEYVFTVGYFEKGQDAGKEAEVFAEAQTKRLEDALAGETLSEDVIEVPLSGLDN